MNCKYFIGLFGILIHGIVYSQPSGFPIGDVSGIFNEREFVKSNSYSYEENEIINDFNGNLQFNFPLANILNDTSSVTLKIFYNDTLKCEVNNNSIDTILLLLNPFIIQGDNCFLKSAHVWVGTGNKYTCPNIFYYSKKGEIINFTGDGEYEPFFLKIPELLRIDPGNSTILFYKVEDKYHKIFNECEMQFQVMLNFAFKKEFDSLISYYQDTLKTEYLSAINYSSDCNIYFLDIEEYKNIDNYLKDNLFGIRNKIIKKVMRNKIGAVSK